MKKKYVPAEIRLVSFDYEDIISTSVNDNSIPIVWESETWEEQESVFYKMP